MSRDIKFRLWSKNKKKYLDSKELVLIIYDDSLPEIEDNSIFLHDEDFIIEQYTGLKDKNGVEIYEGDIIDTHWGNEENRLVKYDNEMGFYLTPDQDQHYWTVAYRGEYEVIGNIHENADLLVDDTDRISPDDIGNDIHEFLHGGDK